MNDNLERIRLELVQQHAQLNSLREAYHQAREEEKRRSILREIEFCRLRIETLEVEKLVLKANLRKRGEQ